MTNNKRAKLQELKRDGNLEVKNNMNKKAEVMLPQRQNGQDCDSEIQEQRSLEEGLVRSIDNKSFGAKPSKFQTSPNNRRKVIIVDDEEEKEFGIHDSILMHMSQGTVAAKLALPS